MSTQENAKTSMCKYIDCENAENFFEKTSPWGGIVANDPRQFTTLPWVFRGQSNSAWPLQPTMFRKDTEVFSHELGNWRISKGNATYEQAKIELITIQRFYLLADQQGLLLPEDSQLLRESFFHPDEYMEKLEENAMPWPPYELLSLFGLAQHHGVPTRLLDWTRNIMAAIYFACVGAAKEYYSIRKAEQANTISQGQTERRDNGKFGVWALDLWTVCGQRSPDPAIISVTAPAAGNRNLYAQEGLFTVDNPKLFDWKGLTDFRSLENKIADSATDKTKEVLYLFSLPISHAANMLTLLAKERITAARYFPGFDGVVQALREQKYWCRLGQVGVHTTVSEFFE